MVQSIVNPDNPTDSTKIQMEYLFNEEIYFLGKYIFEGENQNALNNLDLFTKLLKFVSEEKLGFLANYIIINNRINPEGLDNIDSFHDNKIAKSGRFEANLVDFLMKEKNNENLEEIFNILEIHLENSDYNFDEIKKIVTVFDTNEDGEDKASSLYNNLYKSMFNEEHFTKLKIQINEAKEKKIDLSKLLSIKEIIYSTLIDEPINEEFLIKIKLLLQDPVFGFGTDFLTENDNLFVSLLRNRLISEYESFFEKLYIYMNYITRTEHLLHNDKTIKKKSIPGRINKMKEDIDTQIEMIRKMAEKTFLLIQKLIPNTEINISSFNNTYWSDSKENETKIRLGDMPNPFKIQKD